MKRFKTPMGRQIRARMHGRWSPWGRQRGRSLLLRGVAIALVVTVVGGYGATAYAQSVLTDLPTVNNYDALANNGGGDTQVFDSKNSVELADAGGADNGGHRVTAKLADISPKLIQATVATEDKTFWTNSGFEPKAVLRAGFYDLLHRHVVGGGSTITQQLAKQIFLTPAQNLSRKLQELALAYQLNKTYSKSQILELYLNRNPYGEQLFGVETASQTYFHKSAKDLDLGQAALLAGIPQSPPDWDPVLHPDQAKHRRKVVLAAMVRDGYITSQESSAADQEPIQVSAPENNYQAPHFVRYVFNELEQLGFHPGLQQLIVKTTLDWNKQQIAQKVVVSNLAKQNYRDPYGLTSAMVSMDPKTGELLAYVGSPGLSYGGGQFDYISQVAVNAGSSMKPFTYGAAIDGHVATMDTPILDEGSPPPAQPNTYVVPQIGKDPYQVQNYDKQSHGVQPLRKAFASSLNIPAVKTEMAVGIPEVVAYMRRLGLKPRDPNGSIDGQASNYAPALTLGGAPVSLLDEIGAYSVYANMGTYHPPEAILQVSDPSGKILYQAHPEQTARQVLDPGVAFIISSIISNDSNRTVGFRPGGPLNLPGRKAAAKTGTTDDFHDAVTAGYTPDLVSLVWLGDYKDGQHHMTADSDAVVVAAPAWNSYMTQALAGTPDHWYQMPSDVVTQGNGSYFLKGVTSIDHLPGDSPIPPPTPSDSESSADPDQAPIPIGGSGGSDSSSGNDPTDRGGGSSNSQGSQGSSGQGGQGTQGGHGQDNPGGNNGPFGPGGFIP
ncbi:MAG: transglycosylase domain-containing protein [Candidatus Dormibacteraceae bacterium]